MNSRRNTEGGLMSPWLSAAVIVIAAAAAYSNSLRGPFVFDDVYDIVGNASIRHLWPLRDVFVIPGAGGAALHPRPLANLTLAVNYAMGGLNPLPYHVTNLVVHVLAGLTLFGIVRRTLLLPGLAGRFGGVATPLALAVSLLWTLHPIQTQAVTYVIQRYESLMGLFFLCAVYALIRSDASSHRRAWTAASVAAALAAMGCKEVAVSAPLCLLLYDRAFLAGSFRGAWVRRRGMYCGLAGVWAAFAVLQVFSADRSGWAGYRRLVMPWFDYAKTQPGVILHYVRMSFWPHPLVLDYRWPVARSPGEILPGALVVGGLAAASALALVRWPMWGFLGAWFFLILAPTSSVLPIADAAYIHRMYLPSAAIVAAVVLSGRIAVEAVVRRRWLPKPGAAAAGIGVVTAVAVALAAGTWRRNNDYRSTLSIWADTAAKAPRNARANSFLGVLLADGGRVDEGIGHARKALEIEPQDAGYHNNLGYVLAAGGRIDEAVAEVRKALEIEPEYDRAHYNLGNIQARLGQIDEAIADYRRALKINPDLAEAHNNLGIVLAGRGETDEAVAHFRKALETSPEDAEIHNNLGIVLADRGRTDEAIAQYQQALEIRPDYAEARNNLGVVLAGRGRIDDAVAHFRKTLEIKPDHAEARKNLAAALAERRRAARGAPAAGSP